jgi:hypothetical protein
MSTIVIAEKTYQVLPLGPEDYESYQAYSLLLAQAADNPLERFFVRNQNLTPQQQEIALRVERSLPEWSDPPHKLVSAWARHPKAVAALCRRVLFPKKSGAEWEKIIGGDADAIYDSLVSVLNATAEPSDDQIRQSNQALREALAKPRTNAGGWPDRDNPEQPQSQGAGACDSAAETA